MGTVDTHEQAPVVDHADVSNCRSVHTLLSHNAHHRQWRRVQSHNAADFLLRLYTPSFCREGD
ncbi:MAG: hypothetical protein Q4G03_04845 [Planctomycetia bacterium]|nr:hypothetical protein [Planctomycetia bacterium]